MTEQNTPTAATGFVRGNDRVSRLLADTSRAERVAALEVEQETADRAFKMNLATVRQAGRLTQVELAQRLGVNQTSVSRTEARSDLLLSTLVAYLNAAGVDDVAITGTIAGRRIEIDLPATSHRPPSDGTGTTAP